VSHLRACVRACMLLVTFSRNPSVISVRNMSMDGHDFLFMRSLGANKTMHNVLYMSVISQYNCLSVFCRCFFSEGLNKLGFPLVSLTTLFIQLDFAPEGCLGPGMQKRILRLPVSLYCALGRGRDSGKWGEKPSPWTNGDTCLIVPRVRALK